MAGNVNCLLGIAQEGEVAITPGKEPGCLLCGPSPKLPPSVSVQVASLGLEVSVSSFIRTAALALSRGAPAVPRCQTQRPPSRAHPASASGARSRVGCLLLCSSYFYCRHFPELSLGQELSVGANRGGLSGPSQPENEQADARSYSVPD